MQDRPVMKANADPQTRTSAPRRGRSMLVSSALTLAGLVLPLGAETASTLRETLARGLVAEEVNRDLESARRDYETVLAEFADQRAVAASALFRLAEIHRAQGRKDEAVAHYQRLLREFPDADREKDLARRQLAEWQIAPEANAPALAAIDDEEAALQRLKQLLQNRPDVFRKAENEVQEAITNGWLGVLGYLLEQGRDPGRALFLASASGNLEAVKFILAQTEKPDGKTASHALSAAIRNDHEEVFRTLLAADLDLNYQPDADSITALENHGTLLHTLESRDNIKWIRLLIEAGADVNAASSITGYTPLHIALRQNRTTSEDSLKLVKLLLDKGADVNARTTLRSPDWKKSEENPEASLSALEISIYFKPPNHATLLIERGADAKQEGLLATACSMRDGLEITRLLLDHRADPNAPADNPPIIRAFQNIISQGTPNERLARHRQQVALIRLLLERGANPNITHGTFQRTHRRPVSGSTDFGIHLFTPPVENSVELPAGLFHQVMKLHSQHNILNLELVKDLLDAGAVPEDEFPEIFAFVATHGKSMLYSSRRRLAPGQTDNITMEEGDGNPVEIARALLAHRPAEVFPENLRAREWDSGVHRLVLDEVVYPPLAAIGGILLSDIGRGTVETVFPPDDTIPDTATLIFNYMRNRSFATLTCVRREPENASQRTVIDWQGTTNSPSCNPATSSKWKARCPTPNSSAGRFKNTSRPFP